MLPADDDPADVTSADPVGNTYDLAPGSLVVTKTIAGSAAGQQGDVVISVSCTNGLNQTITVPGRSHRRDRDDLRRPARRNRLHRHRDRRRCDRDHLRHHDRVTRQIEIPAGDAAAVQITNTYEPAPGSLVVTKTIAGSAAGQQGEVVINVSCTNGLNQDIVIPAGTTADTSQTFDGLPAGTQCTLTETSDGVTVGTSVTTVISADPIIIPAGIRVGVTLTNTYSLVPPDTTEPTEPTVPLNRLQPVVPTDPTTPSDNGNELPETGVSPELFMAGLIGALFVGVGAILLVAGRRRGPEPTRRAGD